MADSIRKRITDQLMLRLGGDTTTPMPSGLGTVKLTKNRTTPISASDLPTYSVYFLHNMPKPIGDPRRATVNQNHLTIETRIIGNGNDDAVDAHCQWVTLRMGTADRMAQIDGTNLALSIVEGETFFESLEGSKEERTVVRQQWIVEFQASRSDMTSGSAGPLSAVENMLRTAAPFGQTPAGLVDGVNRIFTISVLPLLLELFNDGAFQVRGTDYTIAVSSDGWQITFTNPPTEGATLYATGLA